MCRFDRSAAEGARTDVDASGHAEADAHRPAPEFPAGHLLQVADVAEYPQQRLALHQVDITQNPCQLETPHVRRVLIGDRGLLTGSIVRPDDTTGPLSGN